MFPDLPQKEDNGSTKYYDKDWEQPSPLADQNFINMFLNNRFQKSAIHESFTFLRSKNITIFMVFINNQKSDDHMLNVSTLIEPYSVIE